MIPMPFKIRMFVLTSVKTIPGPPLYLKRLTQSLGSLLGIDLHYHKLFSKITTRFMIQYNVQINSNMIFVQFVNHFLQFIFRTIFSSYGSLLVKFAQVIQIISRISFVLLLIGLISRGNPNSSHTYITKMRRIFLYLFP